MRPRRVVQIGIAVVLTALAATGMLAGSLAVGLAVAFTSDGTAVVGWNDTTAVRVRLQPPGQSFGSTTPIYVFGAGENANIYRIATDAHGGALLAHVGVVSN